MSTTTRRTGQFQRLRKKGFKTSSELSIWKHLAFIWGGGIIAWPLLTATLGYAYLPSGEAFTFTLIVVLANIFLGWIPALFIFLLNWGIRGWIGLAQAFMQSRAQDRAEAQKAQAEIEQQIAAEEQAQQPRAELSEEEVAAQWQAMNPYGCCMDHRDAEGYPSHGGPNCQHPALQ